MESLNNDTFAERIARVESGICFVFKMNCPHCLTMRKVLEKFQTLEPDAEVFDLNAEENRATTDAIGVERVPTMCILRNGKISSRRVGLMNPRDLRALYLMMGSRG